MNTLYSLQEAKFPQFCVNWIWLLLDGQNRIYGVNVGVMCKCLLFFGIRWDLLYYDTNTHNLLYLFLPYSKPLHISSYMRILCKFSFRQHWRCVFTWEVCTNKKKTCELIKLWTRINLSLLCNFNFGILGLCKRNASML